MMKSMIAEALDKVTGKSDKEGESGDSYETPSKDEIDAMKAFTSAGSPEEKAAALKAFIRICTGEL